MLGSLLLVTSVALGSAVLPLISIEVFVVGMMYRHPDLPWLAVGLAAAVGQVAGKTLYFLAARAEIRLPDRLRPRVTIGGGDGGHGGDGPVAPRGPIRERIRTWYAWLREKCERSRNWLLGTLAVSSLVGLPPVMLTTVLAGLSRMRLRCYLAISFPGRLIRFAALACTPALLAGWLW